MNPFPGLRPFTVADSGFFAGREVVTDSVVNRVRIAPLTLMFARSGVGKSSFLNCRLVPELKDESAVLYVNEWGAAVPERIVAEALTALSSAPKRLDRPVLVLDQFEDVFKTPRPRDVLWDTLSAQVNLSESRVHVLVSMREEWLGAWQEAEDYLPDALASLVRLRPLSHTEVLRAIREPAEREGAVRFDPALAVALAGDLRRRSPFGSLGFQVEAGLLQLVCRRLWSVAQSRGMTVIAPSLYEELGGADVIIREFVWNELGSAGLKEKEIPDPERPGPRFSAGERVALVGLTRHLIVAHGVKSTVSAEGLCRGVLASDLGVAGPAVVEGEVSSAAREYLELQIEKRPPPPEDLVEWIHGVLDKATEVGFMKRQQRLLAVEVPGQSADAHSEHIFELAHDALADIFQSFKIEFEGWVRTKFAKLVGIVVGLGIIAPGAIILILTLSAEDLFQIVSVIVFGAVFMALYVLAIVIFGYIFRALARVILYPIFRRLVRGRVPLRLMRR